MRKAAVVILFGSIPLVVLAFWPMYLSKLSSPIDRYTHFHAAIGVLWFITLIVQPILIHKKRYSTHKFIGRISHLLAPLFVIASLMLSHSKLVLMDEATFASEGFAHYLPLYASIAFAFAYGLGIVHRKDPEVHGRFMMLTAMPMIDPVLGRVLFFYFPPLPHPLAYQAITFGVATLAAAILVFSYRSKNAARSALVGYFLFYLVLEIGWFTITGTSLWLDFVAWYRSLPLT